MKNITLFLILSCLIYLTGCTKKEEKNVTTTTPQQTTTPPPSTTPVPTQTETDKQLEEKKEPEKKDEQDKSGAIRVNFPPGKVEMVIKGKINGLKDKITYVVHGTTGQVLFAKLMASDPDKNPDANLNLVSIISPSGIVKGPFGVKTKYDLTETGDWRVVVGQVETFKSWKGEYDFIINVH